MTKPTIQRIKSKLKIIVGLTISAVLVLSAWDMYTDYGETIALAERQSADYARVLADHTESSFAEADGMLREIVHDISINKHFEKMDRQLLYRDLKARSISSPQIGALFLVDRDGVMFTNTQEDYPPRQISVADRDYFQNYLNNKDVDFTIGKPVMSRLVKRWRFNLMRSISRPGQPFNGLIAAAFEVDFYKRFLSQSSLGPHGRIILMRNDGVPLVVQPYIENVYQADFKKTKLFQEAHSRKSYGTYHVANSSIDNAHRIISFNRLSRFPVVAIVSLDHRDILKPWIRKSIIQSSFTVVLCFFVVVLTRAMFRHLDTLQEVQTELAERSSLLAASVNEQRIILNNVTVGIGFIKNRTIQWANAAHDRMFGCSPGETRGVDTCRFYADAEECRRVGDDGYKELASGGMYSTEVVMKKTDGSRIPCLVTGQAIDPEKPGDGSIWVIQDMSDIKSSEAERLSLLEQVQHARHLENLGTLAGGIAHDFNNLLMVIQGATDLSKIKLGPQSPAQPYLAKILKATHDAAVLCQKMLAYSGNGFYRLEKIHLKALLEPVCEQVRASLCGTEVTLALNVPDDLPLVKADAGQLRQSVICIVNNAVEALADQPGSITVSGYKETAGAGASVVLEVADTGCGMDEDTLRRVFDPFFSTKFTGRGLDMSAVSGIIKSLKGTIDIQSSPGKGTTVRLVIPACCEEIIPAAPDSRSGRGNSDGRPTVLLVDDDELLRDTTGTLLDALGYSVVFAENGREALRLYAELGYAIDLLLLDMTMPEMDGAEVLHELRAGGSKVPVLLSSGYSREDVSLKIAEDELTVFIQKPFTVECLKTALEKVVAPAPP